MTASAPTSTPTSHSRAQGPAVEHSVHRRVAARGLSDPTSWAIYIPASIHRHAATCRVTTESRLASSSRVPHEIHEACLTVARGRHASVLAETNRSFQPCSTVSAKFVSVRLRSTATESTCNRAAAGIPAAVAATHPGPGRRITSRRPEAETSRAPSRGAVQMRTWSRLLRSRTLQLITDGPTVDVAAVRTDGAHC